MTSVADGLESGSSAEVERPTLPRSTSERLLAANRDFVAQEKELREKYHEVIYGIAEKVMRTSQTNQFKSLKVISMAQLEFCSVLSLAFFLFFCL